MDERDECEFVVLLERTGPHTCVSAGAQRGRMREYICNEYMCSEKESSWMRETQGGRMREYICSEYMYRYDIKLYRYDVK